MRTVLLVHPDAAAWADALGADVTTAATAKEARAYLAGTAFDAVLVGPGVAPEPIAALRDVLGLSTTVEAVGSVEEARARIRGGASTSSDFEPAEALEAVRAELGRVAHALNNPLAVIAGNAQLAGEVARAVPTDETIADALRAIGDAAAELEALFADVAGLRALVERALEANGAG